MAVVNSWSAEDCLKFIWHCSGCGRAWKDERYLPKGMVFEGRSGQYCEGCYRDDIPGIRLVNGWDDGKPYYTHFDEPLECHCIGYRIWSGELTYEQAAQIQESRKDEDDDGAGY